ncbi:MAG: ABC transporter substrate-binding protein, partial [Isosphaeraceae bacterium]
LSLGSRGQQPASPEGTERSLRLSPPYDLLSLSDGSVLKVEPIHPRPLPPYDPSKDPSRKTARNAEPPPREGNIGLPGDPPRAQKPPEVEQAPELTIHTLEGEVRDFTIRRASVRSVAYYEDLLLAESERMILARDFTRAFECLLRIKATSPDWRGLDDQVNRLLFAEGNAALIDGDGDRGLRLLREVFTRKPDYPGLKEKLAESYGARAAKAFGVGQYARGRQILRDAETLAANHPTLRTVRERFLKLAGEHRDRALTLEGPARLDALAEALRVWPEIEGTEAPFRAAFAQWPTLDVGVTDVPRDPGPWVRSPADDRVTRLIYLPTLERDDEDAYRGDAHGQLARSLTATDLGSRLVLQLRDDVRWSDGSRPVSAIDVSRALTDAADPASPRYQARWADLLDRVEIPEESAVEIRLTRPLLKVGAWLLGPVGPAHGGTDGRVTTGPGARELVGDGPYRVVPTPADRFEVIASDSAVSSVKVRRIREIRYDSAASALGAFDRGEIPLLAHVPARAVPGLAGRESEGVHLGRHNQPMIHQIALDGRTPALRNRSLRRGLSYAIDRRALLEESILGRPADTSNLVADGIFPRGSPADAPDVKPLGYDPLLARMLVAGAKKELGLANLELTFEYPATPEAQAVAPRLVEALTLAGLSIKAVERPESELEAELRGGRRFDLAYRALPSDEPVMDAGPSLSPAYDAPASTDPLAALASPRLLQLLLLLERAPEFPTARGLLVQIDRESRDELATLPLWQVERHYAWRARLKGPADSSDRLYQGIETWEVEPWFAKDPS